MQNETVKKIQEYALEEIMGLRFGAYAKEIIQDRAIPDVRDGLKPVQRRILYDMYINHNDSAHPFTKCAKTVGDVLGKFHPHGDSSVYDAMVRMSQWWKQSMPLIDIHVIMVQSMVMVQLLTVIQRLDFLRLLMNY